MTVSLQHSVTARVARRRRRQRANDSATWPDEYTNTDTGKAYIHHNDEEHYFVYADTPRYALLKGGEGGGKSVAGIIKTLGRLRRGMPGAMVSPDLEHFKKSLWPEFARWCPWQCVIERHRYRQQPGWEPTRPFTLVFRAEAGGYVELLCGGAKESEIGGWEGPNLSFVFYDEARRHKTPAAIKVFDGRARIPGPAGEPPQIFLTTTPRKHWLFEYFAGARGDEQSLPLVPEEIRQKYADFKADAYVATVLTEENAANLSPGFVEQRRQTLDEAEARIALGAEWEDEEDVAKFVNIIWWDNCHQDLPGLSRNDPMVVALDAAKGGETNVPDCFAMIGVTRDGDSVAVRYCGIWQPQSGQLLDFGPAEEELKRLCREFSVIEVAYDPYQLHDMATRLKKAGVAHFREFGQQKDRLQSDKLLQQLIMSRRIAHDGNPLLRQHVDNANIKKSEGDGIRIVKRSASLKVDATVALSMAAARILYYNL